MSVKLGSRFPALLLLYRIPNQHKHGPFARLYAASLCVRSLEPNPNQPTTANEARARALHSRCKRTARQSQVRWPDVLSFSVSVSVRCCWWLHHRHSPSLPSFEFESNTHTVRDQTLKIYPHAHTPNTHTEWIRIIDLSPQKNGHPSSSFRRAGDFGE